MTACHPLLRQHKNLEHVMVGMFLCHRNSVCVSDLYPASASRGPLLLLFALLNLWLTVH